MILAAFVSVFSIMLQGSTSLTDQVARNLIDADTEVVQRGYRQYKWISNGMLWYDVQSCSVRGFDTFGAQGTCTICSIDDVGGQTYSNAPLLYRGTQAPSNAVAITVSRAHFFRSLEGWKFVDFEPFGANYIAANRHPYLSYDLPNLREQAPSECAEMENLSEVIVRG